MSNIIVLDTETTGFNFSKTDRIVEIAAIKYNQSFDELGRFETLLNPRRDLGAQHVHGIEAAWVLNAPQFADVCDELLTFMDNSIIIGHNIEFDLNFLKAELKRIGRLEPNFEGHYLDTLKISQSLFGPSQACKLSDLAVLLDLETYELHAAVGDVLTTVQLMRELVARDVVVSALLNQALDNPLSIDAAKNEIPIVLVTRPRISNETNVGFILSLVDALPSITPNSADRSSYLEYLRRAIADGVITNDEAEELLQIAQDIGLSLEDIAELHKQVFSGITMAAWADGQLSEFEKGLIEQVARQLGVGDLELEAAKSGKGFTTAKQAKLLNPGDVVVLTGTMEPPKVEVARRIIQFGAEVSETLTKKATLLVAADPNTLSGKGQKARRWGIPIVSTAQLLSDLQA
jgi:DNA polymerase-3 subunit epsilon